MARRFLFCTAQAMRWAVSAGCNAVIDCSCTVTAAAVLPASGSTLSIQLLGLHAAVVPFASTRNMILQRSSFYTLPLLNAPGHMQLAQLQQCNTARTSPSMYLRPAEEVIDRILWDPALEVKHFTVGYIDRFNGVQETPIAAPNLTVKGRARLFVKAIPQARIAYVKYKQRIVWDRESRIDIVFGSSVNGAVKIDDAIAEYERFSTDSFSIDSYAEHIVPESSSTSDSNSTSSPDYSSSSNNANSGVQLGAETDDCTGRSEQCAALHSSFCVSSEMLTVQHVIASVCIMRSSSAMQLVVLAIMEVE
eukprot:13558-Heterococcus_DN1.PRE.3